MQESGILFARFVPIQTRCKLEYSSADGNSER